MLNPTKTIERFQFISDGKTAQEHLDGIKEVCEAGGKWVQLRMKNFQVGEVLEVAKEARNITAKYESILILNDHVSVAKEVKADGVHLGKTDMSPSDARIILGYDAIIGATANNHEELTKLPFDKIDYVGLGPFRFTTTKKNLSEVLKKEEILSCVLYSHVPLIMVGGIHLDDLQAIYFIGIHGVAVSGAVNKSENRKESTQSFLQKIKEIYND